MRDTESTIVKDSVTATGICTSCIHASTCLYQKAAKHPIWFCEMFESEFGKALKPEKHTKVSSPEIPLQTRLPGLCANCEKRETCTLPKAEGGVWHCEEYA